MLVGGAPVAVHGTGVHVPMAGVSGGIAPQSLAGVPGAIAPQSPSRDMCGSVSDCASCSRSFSRDAHAISYMGPIATSEATYKYVGGAAGEAQAMRVVPTSVPTSVPNYFWCIIPVLLLWALVFLYRTRPQMPMMGGPRHAHTCVFWGDPHFWTFDNQNKTIADPADAYRNGDFWIVKTDRIWIQARYRPTKWLMTKGNHRACARAIAFGGPFLQRNKFIIEAMEKSTTSIIQDGQITYNGAPVLTMMPSNFSKGPVNARYHNQGVALDTRMSMPLHVVDVQLPNDVHAVVNRWRGHIDAKITMLPAAGMSGHCGDFNGDPNNDQSAQRDAAGAHRPLLGGAVSPSELLFAPSNFADEHNIPQVVAVGDTYAGRSGLNPVG